MDQSTIDEQNYQTVISDIVENKDSGVTATSVGGNKSDKYIKQTLRHYTIIRDDGTMLDELSITRKHTWSTSDFEEWKNMLAPFGYSSFPEHIMNILGFIFTMEVEASYKETVAISYELPENSNSSPPITTTLSGKSNRHLTQATSKKGSTANPASKATKNTLRRSPKPKAAPSNTRPFHPRPAPFRPCRKVGTKEK